MTHTTPISTDDFHIPSSPFVVMGVVREQIKPHANIGKIATLISTDIGLTSDILREVNSPLFGFRKSLTSVQEAIVFLGLNRISTIVMASKMNEMSGVPRDVAAKVWEHSRRVAEFSSKLMRHMYSTDVAPNNVTVTPEDAYTIGMLHDCGIFIRAQNDPEYVRTQLLKDIDNDFESDASVHAILGAELLKKWYLPKTVYESVRFHHELKSVPSDNPDVAYMVAVLILAERMAKLINDPFGDQNREFFGACSEAIEYLQLTQDEFVDIQYTFFDQLA